MESPDKARTLGNFLSKDYTVKASVGHIRDLPPYEIGVDVDNNFRLWGCSNYPDCQYLEDYEPKE